MFRMLGFLVMIAGTIFVLFMLTLYGTYSSIMITALAKPRKTPISIEELTPIILVGSIFLSLFIAFICAVSIKKLSKSKGIKHALTRVVRLLFVGSIVTFILSFFVSSLFIETYLRIISTHHSNLICIRNNAKIDFTKDILFLPDSPKTCAEFQSMS